MELLILFLALYVGGIIATIGFMLAGMTKDNNLNQVNAFGWIYAFTACVAWPFTILQQMTTNDEV